MKKISIITTTINIPIFLNDIVKNIKIKRIKNIDLSIIVVADKKTPKKLNNFV